MIPIIGIAGGSGSGKTSLIRAFENSISRKVTVFCLDWYYRDLSHLPHEARSTYNFDSPEALEVDLFVRDLLRLAKGQEVEVPIYDFRTHTRTGTKAIIPRQLILADGILIYAIPQINSLFTHRIFMKAPEEIRLSRRINRDLKERGRTFESIVRQYRDFVQPMHEKYVVPSMHYADLILDAKKSMNELLADFTSFINNNVPGVKKNSEAHDC